MKKTLSLSLAIVIFFTQALFSPSWVEAAQLDFWRSRALARSVAAAPVQNDLAAFAQVEPRLSSFNNTPTVVLIQDIHHNPEAQRNIGEVLKRLKNTVVGAEAAHGGFDFEPFREFPVAGAVKNIADYLLSTDKISAVSWAGLTSDQSLIVSGVDDPELYAANVRAYQDAAPIQSQKIEDVLSQISGLEKSSERLSPAGRAIFAALLGFHRGTLTMADYVSLLSRQTRTNDLREIQKFLRALRLENNLDVKQAAKERDNVLAGSSAPQRSERGLAQIARQGVKNGRRRRVQQLATHQFLEPRIAQVQGVEIVGQGCSASPLNWERGGQKQRGDVGSQGWGGV
jgi:hypothetical protein